MGEGAPKGRMRVLGQSRRKPYRNGCRRLTARTLTLSPVPIASLLEAQALSHRERANQRQLIVGMMKLESSCSSALSGQRAVAVLVLVQNFTPSMPYWLVSPKPERFQPPKEW